MRCPPRLAVVALLLRGLAPVVLVAQQAPSLPPLRALGPIIAAATDSIGFVGGLRQLSNGQVIVSDPDLRRVLLFDASLSHPKTLLDTVTTSAHRYPVRTGPLIAYIADSTLMPDFSASAFLVIDPAGMITRVTSLPTLDKNDLLFNLAGSDGRGGLIFEQFAHKSSPAAIVQSAATAALVPTPIPDSSAIIRGNLATHRLDTIGYVKGRIVYPSVPRVDSMGMTYAANTVNPLPVDDGFAILSDGTLAIVRGQDFHVDFVSPDGGRSSSPRLPHEWHRLSDEDKVAIIDSLRTYYADPAHQLTIGVSINGAPPYRRTWAPNLPDPSLLADYRQAFNAYGVLPDADGNVWIAESRSAETVAGPIYDIVNRQGVMVDRIRLPGGVSIAGFGSGVVFLTSRTGTLSSLVCSRIR